MDDDSGAYEAPATAQRLLVIMLGLVNTLTPQQRAEIFHPFDDPRRLDWDIIPRPDPVGLAVHQMDQHQRVLVQDLLRRAMPLRTYTKTLAIPQLEHVLRDYEGDFLGPALQTWRSSENYRLSVFGRPGFEDTWTFRFLGHHVCVNVTVVEERWVFATPAALGQQPATYDGVLTPLARDEGLGFDLLESLDREQREVAVIHDVAPADFVTRQVPLIGQFEYPDFYDLGMPQYVISADDRRALKMERTSPSGISGADLTDHQRTVLHRLVEEFLLRLPEETLPAHRAEIEASGWGRIHFAWAGGTTRGTPHYFRVQTARFVIELVNAVNDGQHIHSVIRDLEQDFGQGLLADRQEGAGARLRTRTTSSAVLDPGL